MEGDPITPLGSARRSVARRRLRAAAAVLLLGLAVVAGLTARWFIWPHSQVPESADAIVVLGGGRGERLVEGLALERAGVSDIVVLSTGVVRYAELQPVYDLCESGSPDMTVMCVTASPDNTKGEAMDVAALAEEQGWRSIVLVTSDHHLERSLRWFERCFDGTIYPVAAPVISTFGEVLHEWLGVVQQTVLDRSCQP
jgi:uncharacterized SAM-binding protein YcdF (DUF218 family)